MKIEKNKLMTVPYFKTFNEAVFTIPTGVKLILDSIKIYMTYKHLDVKGETVTDTIQPDFGITQVDEGWAFRAAIPRNIVVLNSILLRAERLVEVDTVEIGG